MLTTIIATSAVSVTTLAAASAGFMHYKYSNSRAPPPYSPKEVEDKKEIVIVGSGVIGLTTAYYLSKDPNNNVVILERSSKPYQFCSFQNGCYFHTQGCESWINKPFWMFLQAIYKKDHFSKVYLGSMFKDPATTLKFGYLWFFKQPNKDGFAKSIIKLLYSTETLLKEYLEEEGLTAEDVGYRSDSKIALLQHNNEYS